MQSKNQCTINKNELRKMMKSKRNQMNFLEIREASDEIFEKFLDLGLRGKSAFCYMNANNEVITTNFIEYFKNNNYITCVPYCLEDGEMLPAIFEDFSSLKINKYGIFEPENLNFLRETIDISIIPAVAFDEYGNRVGYGKGYYDRFLAKNNSLKIGVCFEYQISNNIIEVNEFDVKMDYIITEKRIIKI